MQKTEISSPYKGSGGLTREQFLFPETRTVAKLIANDHKTDEEVIHVVVEDNLFQYPTERTIKNIASVCVRRLRALEDDNLIEIVANAPSEIAKQICLYAMMKQYRLVRDFMTTVIGEKYRQQEFSYGRIDLNVFFTRLQEQDDLVATWSDATIQKLKSVLSRILIDNDYIDDGRAKKLNPVMISSELEAAIKESGDMQALAAFNCLD